MPLKKGLPLKQWREGLERTPWGSSSRMYNVNSIPFHPFFKKKKLSLDGKHHLVNSNTVVQLCRVVQST